MDSKFISLNDLAKMSEEEIKNLATNSYSVGQKFDGHYEDNSEIKIDKSVPIPPRTLGRPTTKPWKSVAIRMDVGDSVVVKTRNDASTMLNAINSIDGCRGVQRTIGKGQIRVWKVKRNDSV